MQKILLLIFLLALTGAACSNNATKNTGSTVTSPTVIRQPIITEPSNPFYDFCEEQGHQIIIRFDITSNASKAYCRFPDTTECPANTFASGECGPNKGAQIYEPGSEIQVYENCTQTYEPVCGEGNITFTNECLAKIQGVKIISSGACPTIAEPTIPTTPTKDTPTPTISTPPTTDTSQSPSATPDWVNTAIDIITAQPVSKPKAFIDRCVYNNKTMYYQSAGCPKCRVVLSSETGTALCYPNNDFNNICAKHLPLNNRQDYCKRLWTDSR